MPTNEPPFSSKGSRMPAGMITEKFFNNNLGLR